MPDFPHNPTLEVNLDAIVRNYERLRGETGGNGCSAAVVKANAYGLGVSRVAPALYEAGCRDFFVATLDEAMELRKILGGVTIYAFHGCRKGQVKGFLAYNIIPVLNDIAQLEYWQDSGKYALHIDTGMCRLGITSEEVAYLQPATSNLQLIISHLACANEPSNPMNKQQLALFRQVMRRFPGVTASLANSSGVFLSKDYHCDMLRPGCALYGISPNTTMPNPMENVVTLSAPVLQYRHIDEDHTTVGYGASVVVGKGAVLATVEMGYADGFLRALGNKAFGVVAGIRVPVIGRVSMDMVTVDVTKVPAHLRRNNLRILFIGKEHPVDVIAEAAGTIGYEIFTRLGTRVQRLYPAEHAQKR